MNLFCHHNLPSMLIWSLQADTRIVTYQSDLAENLKNVAILMEHM